MSRTLSFRTASSSDIPRLVTLINTAFQALAREPWAQQIGMPDEPRTSIDSLRADFEQGNGNLIVGEQQGQLVVCAWQEEEADGAGYFGLFAVDPACQGQGVGKEMVKEAERHHRQAGRSCLRIAVIRQRETLIDWYKRLGFALTGVTRSYAPGGDCESVPLDILEKTL